MATRAQHSVTLQNVADLAGCSKAAVSTVLNGSKGNIGVSDAMRQRITDAARELNYRPNFASQSLALKRTRTVGVYIEPIYGGGIAGQYHASILSGIEAACRAENYDVLLVNFSGNASVADCVEKLGQARIDGLLLLHAGHNPRLIDAVLEATRFVVAIDGVDPPDSLQAVMYDHEAGVRLAVEHLVSLGHRRIGYAGPFGSRSVPHNMVRVQAFRAAMREKGLALPDAWVAYDDTLPDRNTPYMEAASVRAAQHFLTIPADQRPTALLAYDDSLAMGLLKQFTERGLSLPRDMSLINFENHPATAMVSPALTCLEHPVYDMGHKAAARLLGQIESSNNDTPSLESPWHHVFQPSLVIRQSTAAPPSLR